MAALLDLAGDAIPETIGGFFESLTGQDANLNVLESVSSESLQIGATDVTAFLGIDGPYWSDIDMDQALSWVAPKLDVDGNVIPEEFVTLVSDDDDDGFIDVVTIDGREYGDVNEDGIVDSTETAELNDEATGLSMANLDLGFAMFTPSIAGIPELDDYLPKLYSLKASADEVGLIGLPEVEFLAQGVDVDLNFGDRWLAKLNLPMNLGIPNVDFASSFPAEDANLNEEP